MEQCFHLWNQSELRWINPPFATLPWLLYYARAVLPSTQPRGWANNYHLQSWFHFALKFFFFVRGHGAMWLIARKSFVFVANLVVLISLLHAKTILVTDHLTASLNVRSLAANANRPKSAS